MVTDKANIKILIVDDDKFLLNMYSLKFSKSAFTPSTATSGAEVLKLIREGFVPDIILLDLVMPGMDGLELLAEIRKEKMVSGATIIMLTNQGQASDINRAQELGVDGYIVKATTIPSEVVAEVSKIYQAKKH